jgi:hypothetical protein
MEYLAPILQWACTLSLCRWIHLVSITNSSGGN